MVGEVEVSNEIGRVLPILKKPVNVVKLSKNTLAKDKEDGLTNKEMSEKYGLSTTNITKALKIVGLHKVRAKTKNKFEIIED